MKSKTLKIGALSIENPTVMAPLAGITNLPFRLMVKNAGCGLVCSEMVSASGMVYNSDKTLRLLDSQPEEKPLSIQIFGADPSIMAEGARMVEAHGADVIDINFGCSVRKVTKTGSGVALMKDLDKSKAVIKAVRGAINTPFTIKIRSGWDPSGDTALKLAHIAEECGVDALAIHPRTATQGFGGVADWSIIKRVKDAISIPVIGNGDILSPEDALRMVNETGCDGVMIGRAAIGNPYIFHGTAAILRGDISEKTGFEDHFNMMLHYLEATVAYCGERVACKMMRSRLGWFVKGLPGCSAFRKSLTLITSEEEAKGLILAYMASLKEDKFLDKINESQAFAPQAV